MFCVKKMFKMLICDRLFALLCFKEIATCFKCTCKSGDGKPYSLLRRTNDNISNFSCFCFEDIGFKLRIHCFMEFAYVLLLPRLLLGLFNLSPQPTKTWILNYETNYMLSHLQCAIILQIL